MHFLIHGIGTGGDILPFIGIGRALRRRGHQVTLMALDQFQRMAWDAGLNFHSLGVAEQYFRVIDDPALWHPSRSLPLIASNWIIPQMRGTYEYIRQVHQPGETRIVGSAAAFGSRLAQEKLGVPLYSVVVSPFLMPSVHDPLVFRGWTAPSWVPRAGKATFQHLLDKMLDRLLIPPVNEMRDELALPRLSGSVRDWWFSPDVIMALFPDWFAARQPDWPDAVRMLDFPYYDASGDMKSSPAEEFLSGPEPYVIFARGSVMAESKEFFASSMEASQRMGVRALLLGGEKPADMPAGVAWFRYVPLRDALKLASAVVHHGGIGTIAVSLAAGVPQVAVPFGHDQYDNAARLERIGVGKQIGRQDYTAHRLQLILRELLGNAAFAAAARSAAVRCVPGRSLEQVCDIVEA